MRNLQEEFEESLAMLHEFDEDYIEILNVKNVMGLTQKAVLLQIYYQNTEIIEKWVPRSLIRLSTGGKYFVQQWFYNKELK